MGYLEAHRHHHHMPDRRYLPSKRFERTKVDPSKVILAGPSSSSRPRPTPEGIRRKGWKEGGGGGRGADIYIWAPTPLTARRCYTHVQAIVRHELSAPDKCISGGT